MKNSYSMYFMCKNHHTFSLERRLHFQKLKKNIAIISFFRPEEFHQCDMPKSPAAEKR
jgi:hypothetical protein